MDKNLVNELIDKSSVDSDSELVDKLFPANISLCKGDIWAAEYYYTHFYIAFIAEDINVTNTTVWKDFQILGLHIKYSEDKIDSAHSKIAVGIPNDLKTQNSWPYAVCVDFEKDRIKNEEKIATFPKEIIAIANLAKTKIDEYAFLSKLNEIDL